ncbi:protoplast secreted protein 2 precursor [Aspergillus welwitschiae]|uniref:Protoplast secreted protein 2 n=1 Tax=Aspergillus welwitschiae TaxID=1341132 RepID=A0A3F3PMC8_9EURO|nr:protoplast secreted protein 2 precursor [Aspergillus welwitschiae]RDH28090.1 protoplast secreted protein 2 precursor [Aspergillus welwitschiae]
MAPRVVITFYSMYSYIKRLMLSVEVLAKMHTSPKSLVSVIKPDISTCFGNFPVQWKAFWDQTGGIRASDGYWSKYPSLFVSTGILGGGQESTVLTAMSTLAYYGFIYISLDYKTIFLLLTNLKEIHGGSGADGSRQSSKLELSITEVQGKLFYQHISRLNLA